MGNHVGKRPNDLKCPKKGCKFQGGSLYLKPFHRKTHQGVKVHSYWVISHSRRDRKGVEHVATHYVGKKLKGSLARFAEENHVDGYVPVEK